MPKERCPICHAEAVYVGLEDLECATPDCPNYGPRPETPLAQGEQLRFPLDQLMYELWCRARAGY